MSEDRFVRQYALVGKRARTKGAELPLDTLVQAVGTGPWACGPGLRAEHVSLLNLCATSPLSLAEIGAHLHVYLGVARVLLGDLIEMNLVAISDTSTEGSLDMNSLERLLNDLKAL
jgi:hypothetical protein